MPGKNACIADYLGDLVLAFRPGEKPRQPLRRQVRQLRVLVGAGAGFFDGRLADIGGEDFERNPHDRGFQKFHQAHGDGIGLLAGGAPRHPDPDRLRGPSILYQGGEHLLLQFLEDRGFPEECRDGDETALAQCAGFLAIPFDLPAVVFQGFEPPEGHAPLDAPRQGAVLVVCEVHSGGAPHQSEYPGQVRVPFRPDRIPRLDAGLSVAREGRQVPCDFGRRQHKIRRTGGDGASRHAVELRGS